MLLTSDLLTVIKEVHSQHADDLCWMDIDKIFAAAGLPVPDRRVGDKFAMAKNCLRFIDTCQAGGPWKSYVELEHDVHLLRTAIGTMVPTLLRCFINTASDIDRDPAQRTLDRVNTAMEATKSHDKGNHVPAPYPAHEAHRLSWKPGSPQVSGLFLVTCLAHPKIYILRTANVGHSLGHSLGVTWSSIPLLAVNWSDMQMHYGPIEELT